MVEVHNRIHEPRSSIYLELERLINIGYVISKKVGKSTHYKTTNPHSLQPTLEKESEKYKFLIDNLNDFSQNLNQLKTTKDSPQTINIYKGKAGIKQLLWNIIESDAKEVIGYSPGQLEDVTDRKFSERWREEFRRRQKKNKIIFNKPKSLTWSDVPKFLQENVKAKTLDENKI